MPPITYLGYTPGQGAGELHALPDLTGWQTAFHNIGPGSTASVNGAPFAMTSKIFDTSNGYPNFPASWGGNAATFASNNGGVAILPLIVFGSGPGPSTTPPAQSVILGFLQSLPAGQKCGFVFISEVESGSDGLTAGQYVANWITISQRLTAALGQMITAGGSASFWTRANFPMVTASLLGPYASASFGNSWLPPPAHVDIYGADFYQNVGPGTTQNVGAQSDNRYQHWLTQVKSVAGPNPRLGCPEYGIRTTVYSSNMEAQRAALLAKDYAYFTGSSRPGGTSAFALLNYWYQMPGGGNNGCFPLCDGSETKAQAAATIAQWQQMIADSSGGPPPQTTITVTNPGAQNSTAGQAGSLQIVAQDSNPALTLTYSATGLPGGLVIDSATGLIHGTLTATGTFSVTVTVADGTGTTGAAVFGWVVNPAGTVTVTVVNPGTQTSTAHVAASLQIGATDSAGNALTYSATGLPPGLSISPAGGLISGTPTTPGTYTPVVTATDAIASVSGNTSFTWQVVASVVTVANPGAQSTITGEVITPLQMTATDSAGAAVTFSATGLPTGLSCSAAGKITGTSSVAGTYSVTVTGTDSLGSAGQALFTWTVAAVTVRVTNPGPLTTNLQDAVSVQIIATDSAGNTLTYSDNGTLPPGLAIASGTGLVTGAPTTPGTFRVTITATDTVPVSGAASFAWTITDIASQLAISIAPLAGQDVFGNSYPAGITVGLPGSTQTTIGMDGTLRYTATVVPMPAMVAGWSIGVSAKVALDILGNLVISFKDLSCSGATVADGTTIWPVGSLPPAYRPPTRRRVACYTDVLKVSGAAFETAALEFEPDGSVQCYGFGTAATRADLYTTLPLAF